RSGTHLYASGLFAYRSINYNRAQGSIDTILQPGQAASGTPADAVSANAGKAHCLIPLVVPFLGVTSDLGIPNLGLGVALYAPLGGQVSWDQNAAYAGNARYPGAVDSPARWYDIDGLQRHIYTTVAGSYRFPSLRLSLGLGVNVVRNEISTTRA